MTSETPSKTYTGGCHCGRFQYEVTTADLEQGEIEVGSCNCSICTINGYLFIYPKDSDFKFTKGSMEELTTYTFGSHKVPHYFCPTCGTSCLAHSIEPNFMPHNTIVNVRTFRDVDLKSLKLKQVDGKRL